MMKEGLFDLIQLEEDSDICSIHSHFSLTRIINRELGNLYFKKLQDIQKFWEILELKNFNLTTLENIII